MLGDAQIFTSLSTAELLRKNLYSAIRALCRASPSSTTQRSR